MIFLVVYSVSWGVPLSSNQTNASTATAGSFIELTFPHPGTATLLRHPHQPAEPSLRREPKQRRQRAHHAREHHGVLQGSAQDLEELSPEAYHAHSHPEYARQFRDLNQQDMLPAHVLLKETSVRDLVDRDPKLEAGWYMWVETDLQLNPSVVTEGEPALVEGEKVTIVEDSAPTASKTTYKIVVQSATAQRQYTFRHVRYTTLRQLHTMMEKEEDLKITAATFPGKLVIHSRTNLDDRLKKLNAYFDRMVQESRVDKDLLGLLLGHLRATSKTSNAVYLTGPFPPKKATGRGDDKDAKDMTRFQFSFEDLNVQPPPDKYIYGEDGQWRPTLPTDKVRVGHSSHLESYKGVPIFAGCMKIGEHRSVVRIDADSGHYKPNYDDDEKMSEMVKTFNAVYCGFPGGWMKLDIPLSLDPNSGKCEREMK